jgi:threonine synthase
MLPTARPPPHRPRGGKKKENKKPVAMEDQNPATSVVAVDRAETAVGIECYANAAVGFRAILKERFSDFVVQEIDTAGDIVHLTSLVPGVDDEIIEQERQLRQKLAPTTEPAAAAAAAAQEKKAETEVAKQKKDDESRSRRRRRPLPKRSLRSASLPWLSSPSSRARQSLSG